MKANQIAGTLLEADDDFDLVAELDNLEPSAEVELERAGFAPPTEKNGQWWTLWCGTRLSVSMRAICVAEGDEFFIEVRSDYDLKGLYRPLSREGTLSVGVRLPKNQLEGFVAGVLRSLKTISRALRISSALQRFSDDLQELAEERGGWLE